MKRYLTLPNILLCMLLWSSLLFAQLNGTYTIGSPGDFATFNAAVDSLESQGVAGPVIFNVQDGTYEEQIEINAITGVSETNTITFQSESSDSMAVTLKYEASSNDDNFIIKFNGPSYLSFKQIKFKTAESSYGRAIYYENFTQFIEFLNCHFTGIYHGDNSGNFQLIVCNNVNVDYLVFDKCHIDSSGAGITLASGDSENLVMGIQISNCTMINVGYAAINLNHTYMPQIYNNDIQAHSIGIKTSSAHGPTLISKNRINCDSEGMEIHMFGYGGDEALVVNNFVISGGQNGMNVSGHYINIYNNSIYSTSMDETTSGLYFYGIQNPNTVVIVNNNICRMNAGKAIHIANGSYISECRNNNLYTSGNFIAYWDSVKCVDLAELELKSNMYMHSLSVYPNYISSADLHTVAPWLDGKGFPLVDITDDIDGDIRDAVHPDIGADEFTPDPLTTTPLAGEYTVGGGTYPTIQAAINDAALKGVSAPVTFNILTGTYEEQINIISIPGASDENRITLRSQSGDNADVMITWQATVYDTNFVIRNFGADFISYENLTLKSTGITYSRILDLYLGSDSIEIRNCHFIGMTASGAQASRVLIFSNDSFYRNREIVGNTFEKGAYAVYMRRDGNNKEHARHTEILNNIVLDNGYCAFYLQFSDGLVINENLINTLSYGIYCLTSDNAVEIMKNKIILENGSGSGIQLNSCSASASTNSMIANNCISFISHTGIRGIYLYNASNIYVLFNSVALHNSSYSARAFELGGSNSHDVTIANNNFACLDDGYAFSVENESYTNLVDFNNLYSPGNFLALWNGTHLYDINALQSFSGKNLHSVSVFPQYLGQTDLHTVAPWLNNSGAGIYVITDDIDGQVRDPFKPDIGADEFEADPSTMTPLSGVLTIGSGGAYATLQQAADDAVLKGISGSLIFEILPGTYEEQINLLSIPGSSPENPVIFRSQSGDTSDTEIIFSSTQSTANYVLRFYGADFIHLENLKLSATGSGYARVLDFYLGADSIIIKNNSLNSILSANNSANRAPIYSGDSYFWSREIVGNTLGGCDIGIYMRRESEYTLFPIGTEIKNNTLLNCGYTGIYLQFYDAPHISGNEIKAGSYGIMALTCKNELRLLDNKINVDRQTGMYVASCDAVEEHPGLIANNFIHVAGTSAAYGLFINSSENQNIFHNSIYITGTHPTEGRALYASTGQTLQVKNNILANSGGGYAFYLTTPSGITESDYNDLYSTGANLAYLNGDRTDLAALQTESGMETNSISIDPGFTSTTDLHIATEALDGAGTPLSEVPVDIDGQSRHPESPDIGADEFRTGPNTAPYVSAAIPDQVFDEDTSPHIIADLQIVFTDDDSDDYLTFSVIDYPGVLATKAKDTLTINLANNYYGVGMVYITATDLGDLSAVDSFLVTVNPIPDAPVAVNDNVTTLTNATVDVYPLENDWDVDSDILTIVNVSDPPNGTAAILTGDTVIAYTPKVNFFGLDTIRYIIQDEGALKDTAWIYLTVTNIFSEVETPFAQLSNSVVIAGDYDDDKDLDVFICGTEDGAHNVSQLYQNTGGVFSASQSFLGLMPDNPQGAAWCDFDNDGDLDLIISGIVDNSPTTVSTVLYRNGGGFFTQLATDLNAMWNGSITWADIDNDGDQDFLLMGNQSNDPYDPLTKLWRNDGSDGAEGWIFTDITDGQFPDLCGSSAAWADFDKDGDLDVAIMGMEGLGNPYFDIYTNDGGSFTALELDLTQIGYGQLMWSDYDDDFDPDLLFCGETTGLFQMRNGVLINEGDGAFTEDHPFETKLGLGSTWWVDYDNNGNADAFFTGVDSTFGRQTAAYANTDGVFELAAVSLPAVSHGSMAWGDYNLDGRIDVILSGMGPGSTRKTVYMQNNHPNSNTPPRNVSQLRARTSNITKDEIRFSWSFGLDKETPQRALKYNIYLGVKDDDVSIQSPMSHLDDGYRKIIASGNAIQDTFWVFKGLKSGRLYYFGIQTIDAGYAASEFWDFATSAYNEYFQEWSHPIPGIMHGDVASADLSGDQDYDLLITGMTDDDQYITELFYRENGFYPYESDLPASSQGTLEWKDFDGDYDPDILITGLDPAGAQGYMNDIYINQDGNYTLMDPGIDGIMRGDTKWFDYDNDGDLDIISTGSYGSLPITKLFDNQGGGYVETDYEFIGVEYSSLDIADYDVDGDMDILLTGAINDPPYRLTAIYRNDGNMFTEISMPFTPVSHGEAKWGDYDMDGDMDILLTGEVLEGAAQAGYTAIYRNVNGVWYETPDTLIDLRSSSAAWGDLDNDGDLDCIISGLRLVNDAWQPETKIYFNENNHFRQMNEIYLTNHYSGSIVLADFIKDSNLDIFLCGANRDHEPESNLFWNRDFIKNTPPQIPSNLSAAVSDSLITFTWDAATDAETTIDGLTYNIRIGSQSGSSDIKMCNSDTSGFRIIPEYGNVGAATEWKLNIADLDGGIYWSVQAVDNSFVGSPFATEQYINLTDILTKEDLLPKKYALYQNYPNPFNPSTKIKFDVPTASDIKIVLYNILGEKVRTLVNQKYAPGRHEYVLDASKLAAGLYFYRIKTEQFMKTKRMILIK